MKKYFKTSVFALLFFLIAQISVAQNNAVIDKIVYKSSAKKGYEKIMTLTKDSVIIAITGRYMPNEKNVKSRMSDEEWSRLTNALTNVNFDELSRLTAPTNKRDVDEALYSSFTVYSGGKTYRSSEFDDYNPNQKLQKFADQVAAIERDRQ